MESLPDEEHVQVGPGFWMRAREGGCTCWWLKGFERIDGETRWVEEVVRVDPDCSFHLRKESSNWS